MRQRESIFAAYAGPLILSVVMFTFLTGSTAALMALLVLPLIRSFCNSLGIGNNGRN